ncbi:hypothetical protein C8Q75DRAFT_2355 [Abortiporus biennis]|nr:hypothetical protein C8Q75DRAFT_2355 [Abortiporus biennis]
MIESVVHRMVSSLPRSVWILILFVLPSAHLRIYLQTQKVFCSSRESRRTSHPYHPFLALQVHEKVGKNHWRILRRRDISLYRPFVSALNVQYQCFCWLLCHIRVGFDDVQCYCEFCLHRNSRIEIVLQRANDLTRLSSGSSSFC